MKHVARLVTLSALALVLPSCGCYGPNPHPLCQPARALGRAVVSEVVKAGVEKGLDSSSPSPYLGSK